MGISIIDAINDPELLGHGFPDIESWRPWLTVLRSLFGLRLDHADKARFKDCTGRTAPNPDGHRECFLVCGRRSGKSRILATIAVYLAAFKDWERHLAPGEYGTVMVLARDRSQAKVIFGYVKGLLAGSPMLSDLIVNETAESLELRGRVLIEIHTASFRGVRGRTIIAALLDEIAFWQSDEHSANPDIEVLNAIRPSLATVPGSVLLASSSPYARRGALWRAFDKHFGKDDSAPLIWRAATRTMNELVPAEFIQAQLDDDEAAARAEYLAEFRSDVEGFVKLDVVRACVGSYAQRGYDSGLRYFAFVDPSGGSSDAFTLSVAHRQGDAIHIDAVFAKNAPFSPNAVVDEFTSILRTYRISQVTGDRYAGEFPRELFRRYGVTYNVARKNRSEMYQSLLPLLNSGRITLPQNDRLVKELVGLERNVVRSGRETIDHPRGQHDDLANAVAGAAELCSEAIMTPTAAYCTYSAFPHQPTGSRFDGLIEDGPFKGGFATTRHSL